jgi:phosphopantothenoylcysteine decarboxylase / phosphopantothenate---cysteine ligase
VEVIGVHTAVEMRERVFENLEPASIVIKAAAVADFHLSKVPDQKVKKTAARMSLELDPTPDILAELGRKKGDRLLVGFAAETQNLARKRAASWNRRTATWWWATWWAAPIAVSNPTKTKWCWRYRPERRSALERASKREIADRIFDEIAETATGLHAAHEA